MAGIDEFAKVVLHLDNNITDSSLTPNTFTNSGGVTFSNTIHKFGGYSGIFAADPSTNALTTPTSSSFDLGTADWTIDLWVYWNSHLASGLFVSHDTDANNYWDVVWSTATGLNFIVVSGGVITQRFRTAMTPSDATWYHIAFVRSGANGLIFVDGVSQSITTDAALGNIVHQTGTLKIGYNTNIAFAPDAQLEEIRFSPGVARFTTDFTPSAEPYSEVVVSTGGYRTMMGMGNGSGGSVAVEDSILLETGDDLLLETGDRVLQEA